MKTVYYPADSRGRAEHSWLQSWHTFSFAEYYCSDRMGFWVLRVLNDDTIAPGSGFDLHPHRDMEIISIPLSWGLRHSDTMGNTAVIQAGDIQVMSAGTGILHSEWNASDTEPGNFLQIWIRTRKNEISPRYEDRSFSPIGRQWKWEKIVTSDLIGDTKALSISQDASLYWGEFSEKETFSYTLENPKKNGVYLFVINGVVELEKNHLSKRDGMGIWETSHIQGISLKKNFLLLIEIPMQ